MSAFAHTRQRFRERFNIEYTPKLRQDMLDLIRHDFAEFVGFSRNSPDRAILLVPLENRFIPVVYNYQDHEIITVLPKTPDMAIYRSGKIQLES